jgi:hypothetical protein
MSAEDKIFKRLDPPKPKPRPEPKSHWVCINGHRRWAHEPLCPLCGADNAKGEP